MITIERLDQLMSQMFISSQLSKIGWEDITDADKQVYINNADDEINHLMFIGDKFSDTQKNAFPRIYDNEILDTECVEKAMVQFIYNSIEIDKDETMQRIKSGVISIKIADASESYSTTQLAEIEKSKNTYRKYLTDYIFRGCG